MMERLVRLRPHLVAVRVEDDLSFLLGQRERHLLEGRAFAEVAVRLGDAVWSDRELVMALAGIVSPIEVLFALERLVGLGHAEVVDGAPGSNERPRQDAWWSAAGVAPAVARASLATRTVSVGGADAGAIALAEALAGAGVSADAGGGDGGGGDGGGGDAATVRVVVVTDDLDERILAEERATAARGGALVPCRLDGPLPWVGPALRHADGPCAACLLAQLRRNRPVEVWLAAHGGVPPRPPVAGSVLGADLAARFAALAIASWLVGAPASRLEGHLLSLDLLSLRSEAHRVVRRPECPECGDPDLVRRRAEEPPRLVARPALHTTDGGSRSASPTQTWERFGHLVSPVTGVVSQLGPLAERYHALRPVYRGVYPFTPRDGVRPGPGAFHRVSLGKGSTDAQARVSALCEAIERVSATARGDEPVRRACVADLGDAALPPDALQDFSAAQFAARETLNRGVRDPRRAIPPPFAPAVAIDWTPAWSLTHGRRRWVPATYAWLDHPAPPEERFCTFNPNGHAAGTSLEDAALQAFLELVERDAVALWWYSRAPRPAIDVASFEDAYFVALVDHYRRLGWRVWALDVTTDLDVAAVVALAESEADGRPCVGFGCHLDARIAVQRALTELNQLFDPRPDVPPPWDPAAVTDPAWLRPDPRVRPRRAADLPTRRFDDLKEAVAFCVGRAAARGLETLLLDQTRPDLGLPVAKVIVPGLRHFWPRLGPGRLYDVPVALGWVERKLKEEEMNPLALFL